MNNLTILKEYINTFIDPDDITARSFVENEGEQLIDKTNLNFEDTLEEVLNYMSNNTFISFAADRNSADTPNFQINPNPVKGEPRGFYSYKLSKKNVLSLSKDSSVSGTHNFTSRPYFHLFSVKDINKNIYSNVKKNSSSYRGNVSRDLKNVVFTTLIFCMKSIENDKRFLELEFDKDYRNQNEKKSEQFDYLVTTDDIEDLIRGIVIYTAREMVVVEKYYNNKFKRKLQDETVNVICNNLIKYFKSKPKSPVDKIGFIYDAIMLLSNVAVNFSNANKFRPDKDSSDYLHEGEFSSILLKSIGISSLDQKALFRFTGESDQAVFYDLTNVDYHGTYKNIFVDEYREDLHKNLERIENN